MSAAYQWKNNSMIVKTVGIVRSYLCLEKGVYLCGCGKCQRLGDKLFSLCKGASAQYPLDPGDGYAVHGEFIESEAKENGQILGFAGHLTAHAGVDSCCMGSVHHHLQ